MSDAPIDERYEIAAELLAAQAEIESLRSRLAEAESLFDADIVEIIYGPPCAEYEADCACCRAWRWVDGVKS